MAKMLYMLLMVLSIGSRLFGQDHLMVNTEPTMGILLTDFGSGVEGTKIIITDDDGSLLPLVVTTNSLGQFAIDGVAKNTSFQVEPQKIDDDENGVDSWDLYLLANELNASQFDSPYQKFASDIDDDGVISSKDLAHLNDFLLKKSALPSSWRFYDASCLPPIISPFGICSQSINYDEKLRPLHFIGVKMGDLNNSVLANSNQMPEHIYGQMSLNTISQQLNAGETYDINFSLKGEDVVATQFSLNLGSLELLDVVANGSSILADIGMHLDQNVVTFVAIGGQAPTQSFTIKVKATIQSNLSEELSLATDFSNAKAYDSEGYLYDLKLTFGGDSADYFMLYQNNPNPFGDVTNIRFYLPMSSLATLTIFDLNGQRLKTVQTYCQKGMNNIPILKSDLNLTGIYFYKLAAGDQSAIRKMMLIGE